MLDSRNSGDGGSVGYDRGSDFGQSSPGQSRGGGNNSGGGNRGGGQQPDYSRAMDDDIPF